MSKQKSCTDDFFGGKRPWSLLKDQILKNYLPPYLKKVRLLQKQIILVDGFAGPAVFEDGAIGSPMMFCKSAEEHVTGNYKAFFVNKDVDHFNELNKNLKEYIDKKVVFSINTEAEDALLAIKRQITDETLFIYLDQFGATGFSYNSILPYIARDKSYSTELLMNINVNAIHRLSAKRATEDTPAVIGKRKSLTDALGGDYWCKYLFNNEIDPDEQIFGVINEYRALLAKHIEYVGFCPVYEKGPGSALKYFLVFASRHIDSVVLFNDIMFNAFYTHTWKCTLENTLFAEEKDLFLLPKNYKDELSSVIINELENGHLSRVDLWKVIVVKCFMKYNASDFNETVKTLIKTDKIEFIDVRGTNRLNDDSILKLKE